MQGPGPEPREAGGEGPGPGAARGPARLCGYLQKLSGKGPLRGYRSRWFVFDARRCYLYYFKSPQDALPLGHLDIADACFSYQGPDEAAGTEPPAHFQVHSAGSVTVLKVGPGARGGAALFQLGPVLRAGRVLQAGGVEGQEGAPGGIGAPGRLVPRAGWVLQAGQSCR